jgi:hypothetical protein
MLLTQVNRSEQQNKLGLSSLVGRGTANWPELNFSSSGRLPSKVHGFRLGMSVEEAFQVDPSLRAVGDHSDVNSYLTTTSFGSIQIYDSLREDFTR